MKDRDEIYAQLLRLILTEDGATQTQADKHLVRPEVSPALVLNILQLMLDPLCLCMRGNRNVGMAFQRR